MLKFASADVLSADLCPGASRGDQRVLARIVAEALPGLPNRGARTAVVFKQAHRHNFEYDPRPGFLYVRSRAISSRCNDNYDEFPAAEIKTAYRTFIGKPVFVNHRNENHRRARGVIIAAALHEDVNPDGTPDTWVEVLMEVDAVRFPKLAQAILAGEIDRTSMGTDVAFSVCSFCGNKAATPLEYCAHIPRLKGQRIRRTTASGQQEDVLVREICHGLRFFENSLLVEEPADPTAFTFGVDDRGLRTSAARREAAVSMGAAERKGIARVAYGETTAPADVDTLRDENCPVCGEADSYNGDKCMVCGFVRPPDEFMDPDLEKAQQTDLRQQQDDATAGEGDLKCDNCNKTFHSDTGDGKAPAFIPPKGGAVDRSLKGDDPRLPKSPQDDAGPPDDDPGTAPHAGDACPSCGEGTLQPTGDAAADKGAPEEKDDPDDEDETRDDDDEDGKGKPPGLKDAKASILSSLQRVHASGDAEQKEQSMRPALAALAEQQKTINGQRRIIAAQEDSLRHCEAALWNIAKLAGLNDQPWMQQMLAKRTARIALLKQADVNNPAQPIPDPPAEAPAATTEETLGDLNEADVEAVGAVPGATDVTPDATTSLDAGGTVLDTPLDLNEQDVTAPVAGTEGPRPLDEVKTETEVRSAQGTDEVAFPLEDFMGRKTEARTFAAMRLARLRIQAGVEQSNDDLTLANAIATSDISDDAMQTEIDTLARVLQAASTRQAQRTVPRSLVPRVATAANRTVPSMQSDPAVPMQVVASGPSEDEFLFE